MKAKIHPQYFEDIIITCSCGHSFIAGSTKKEIRTEICSACHPFYTGQQKLVDTAGRVDKFLAKVKQAQKIKEKQVKVVDQELEEMFEDKNEEASVEEAPIIEMVQTEIDVPAIEEKEAPAPKKTADKKSKPAVKAAKPVAKAVVKKLASKAPKAAPKAKPAAKKGKK